MTETNAPTSMSDLDAMAQAYDELHVLDNRLSLEWYPQRVIGMARGSSLLELGLGHGHSTSLFARHFKRYRVIEGSPEMIERFRKRFDFADLDIVHSYFETYGSGERFDNIAMGFILEHVDDPALVLRHYLSFLAPGGSVFVAVPNAESLHRRLGHAAGMLPDMAALSAADRQCGHQRYLSLATLTELVTSQGYEVVKCEGILLKPITTQQMHQLALSPEILQALLKVGVDYPELSNSILMQIRPRQGRA